MQPRRRGGAETNIKSSAGFSAHCSASSRLRGCVVSAINTVPCSMYPSNCFVGKYPSCFECAFCSESMNGRSAVVATRTAIGTRGTGACRICDDAGSIACMGSLQNPRLGGTSRFPQFRCVLWNREIVLAPVPPLSQFNRCQQHESNTRNGAGSWFVRGVVKPLLRRAAQLQ